MDFLQVSQQHRIAVSERSRDEKARSRKDEGRIEIIDHSQKKSPERPKSPEPAPVVVRIIRLKSFRAFQILQTIHWTCPAAKTIKTFSTFLYFKKFFDVDIKSGKFPRSDFSDRLDIS